MRKPGADCGKNDPVLLRWTDKSGRRDYVSDGSVSGAGRHGRSEKIHRREKRRSMQEEGLSSRHVQHIADSG